MRRRPGGSGRPLARASWEDARARAMRVVGVVAVILVVAAGAGACSGGASSDATPEPSAGPRSVVAVESFLADIAQNVAGSRLTVGTLMPLGADPHTFEPTPADVKRVADSQVLIVNGQGFEAFLNDLLTGAGGDRLVIEASSGLTPRQEEESEEHEEADHDHADGDHATEAEHADEHHHDHDGADPHFWLDPVLVKTYVTNVERGLAKADPAGATEYAANAAAYLARLDQLDAWVRSQVDTIPQARRLLVTDHHSFGYYADRYGFEVVGAILPSVSTGAMPSAQQMGELITAIKQTGAPAIFLAAGTNPQLAEQIARDAGVRVVTGLYTHSVSDPGGEAPTYIDMIEYNTNAIVGALR